MVPVIFSVRSTHIRLRKMVEHSIIPTRATYFFEPCPAMTALVQGGMGGVECVDGVV